VSSFELLLSMVLNARLSWTRLRYPTRNSLRAQWNPTNRNDIGIGCLPRRLHGSLLTTHPTVVSEKLQNHKATSHTIDIYNFSKHRNTFFASKQFKCQETEIAASEAIQHNLSESVLSCGNICLMMKWSPENLICCVNMKFLLLYNRMLDVEQIIYRNHISVPQYCLYIYETKSRL
jgi:hypothetical protein